MLALISKHQSMMAAPGAVSRQRVAASKRVVNESGSGTGGPKCGVTLPEQEPK